MQVHTPKYKKKNFLTEEFQLKNMQRIREIENSPLEDNIKGKKIAKWYSVVA